MPAKKPGTTIHLDQKTLDALNKVRDHLIEHSPLMSDSLTIPLLARSIINQWCATQDPAVEGQHLDSGAKPGPSGWAGDENDPKAAILKAKQEAEQQ